MSPRKEIQVIIQGESNKLASLMAAAMENSPELQKLLIQAASGLVQHIKEDHGDMDELLKKYRKKGKGESN